MCLRVCVCLSLSVCMCACVCLWSLVSEIMSFSRSRWNTVCDDDDDDDDDCGGGARGGGVCMYACARVCVCLWPHDVFLKVSLEHCV